MVVFSAIKLNSNPLPWLQKHYVCQKTEGGSLSKTSLHSNLQTSHFWGLAHLFSDPAVLSEFGNSASCSENQASPTSGKCLHFKTLGSWLAACEYLLSALAVWGEKRQQTDLEGILRHQLGQPCHLYSKIT